MKQSKGKAKELRVVVSRKGNRWVASSGDLSAWGHNSRTARRVIGAMIEERYGHANYTFEISLPKSVALAVQKYREDERELRSLTESVPKQMLLCIRELLALNISQQEAAKLLGMKRSHLAVRLMRSQAQGPEQERRAKL